MMRNGTRAVSLDLDNTLVDHSGAVGFAFRTVVDTLAERVDTYAVERRFRAAGARFKAEADRAGLPWWDVREQWAEALDGLNPSEAELDSIAARFTEVMDRSVRPFPDARPALLRLGGLGLPVVVLTNGDGRRQRAKLVRTGLLPLVDAVVASGDLGVHKPHARCFAAAAAAVNVASAELLHAGDDAVHDVRGARAAGVRAVHIRRDHPPSPDSVSDLLALTARLQEGRLRTTPAGQ
ncbi:HAD family hydrolase [Streptomyces sp. NPDC046994]|uniref:HAD family hydrolase n=1 Tax=Streptomyces sp. NPDC046994 TaxID=3155735 RepID=UPI003456B41B